MQTNLTLSIESSLLEIWKKKCLESNQTYSQKIENFMQMDIIETQKDVDKQILEKEIADSEEKLRQLSEQLFQKKLILGNLKEEEKQKEIEALRKKAEEIEKQSYCMRCDTELFDFNIKKFPAGNICKACFMSIDGLEIQKLQQPRVSS